MLLTVDTLSFRVRSLEENNLFDFLHLPSSEVDSWRSSGCFNRNYKSSLSNQGIILGLEGDSGYEFYVHMSGKGCRYYEDVRGDKFSWLDFIREMRDSGVVFFTRIDIACDEFEDLLNHDKLVKYLNAGKFATRCTSKPLIESGRKECIYIGSEKSPAMLRIYNKMLERGKTVADLEEGQKAWNRCEFQLRDDRAEQFISLWLESGDIGLCFFRFLCWFCSVLDETERPFEQSEDFYGWFLEKVYRERFKNSFLQCSGF